MSAKPLVFISHKHKDDDLAKVLYGFLSERCLGRIEIFCSSMAEAAPAPGGSLNTEIGSKLAEAGVLLLVYTTHDEDWSFCMYECGLATDPERVPNTRVIVFQCSSDVPKVYTDSVRVLVHEQESVRGFVISLLTDPEFFPGLGQAIAPELAADSPHIGSMSKDLGAKLRDAAPPPVAEPDDTWPSFDSMTLEVPGIVTQRLKEADSAEVSIEHRELITQEVRAVDTDKFCPQLFGQPSIPKGTKLVDLFAFWRNVNPDAEESWMEELVRQIRECMCWRFPKIRWVSMTSSSRQDRYVPSIHRVTKMPSRDCVQLHAYFLPVIEGREQE